MMLAALKGQIIMVQAVAMHSSGMAHVAPAGRQAPPSYCEIEAQRASDECMLQDQCGFCMLQPQEVAWSHAGMALDTLRAACR